MNQWPFTRRRTDAVARGPALQVVTAGDRRIGIDRAVSSLLRLVRQDLKMDVAFVSEFADGQRVLRHVDAQSAEPVLEAGHSDPLEESLCQRVVDGRAPHYIQDLAVFPGMKELPPLSFAIGTHIGVPVLHGNGEVYGALCCFSFLPDGASPELAVKRLEMAAQVLARLLDENAGLAVSAPD